MNKCHQPITWHNDTTPALNETNLNYEDGCIDIIDDRVVAMDTAKLEAEDVATVIKNITFSDTTGIFTFTRYDNSTFTLDTKLEKVVTNWTYDSSTQSLVLTLADGSTVNIPLSDFITETEFEDSTTIGFTVLNHTVTAVVKGHSIGDAQMQTGYLTDCQAAASTASTAATSANTDQLKSEGYANGTQGGVPVSSGSPYYENNAKYWKEQAAAIAQQSLSGLSDVNIATLSDGDALVYNSTSQEWENKTLALNSLSNVEVTNPQQGDTLSYDQASGKFKNVSATFKTFASATDAEIATMVALADAGAIDLYEDCGWRVGQEHQINLASIASSGTYDGVSWSVGESQSAQTVTLVLMHKGLYELVTPVLNKQGQTRNTCSFVVGVKDSLETKGYINSTNTNTGSWDGCARRSWCNGGFREAIPSALRPAFKQFKTITAQTYNGSTNQTSNDYFALAAEKEIMGSAVRGNATEATALTQFEYYQTASNRIKYINSVASAWWERSPYATSAVDWCGITTAGAASGNGSSYNYGLAPFGCL